MVHERGCDELTETRDWIPLADFSEEALESVDLRHCPACLDTPMSEHLDAVETPAVAAPSE